MKLTERYVDLCRELAGVGYRWDPRPGDWMLDITDESLGMLTTYIENPEPLRRVNVQIPYGGQITDLLVRRGCVRDETAGQVRWRDRAGVVLHVCTAEQAVAFPDEEALAALVADYRRHGAEADADADAGAAASQG